MPYVTMTSQEQQESAKVEPEVVVIAEPTSAQAVDDDDNKEFSDAFDCILCGDTNIRGQRIKPGRNTYVTLCGDTNIDLCEAKLPPHAELNLVIVKLLCGDVNIIVPPGTQVTYKRTALCGDKDVYLDDVVDETAPVVTIKFVSLCGDTKIKSREVASEGKKTLE